MNESFVTVIGNMVGDPTLRTSKNGRQFATFRVASTTRRRDPGSGGYVDGGTNYVNVVVFNGLAANVAVSLRKGEPVIVYGRLRVNQWVGSQNQPMTSVEVEGYSAGHDLTWGQARFAKRGRVQSDTTDRSGGQHLPAALHADQHLGGAEPRSQATGSSAEPPAGPPTPYPSSESPGSFDRTVRDAETDPYEVVNTG